jgi:6-pyruvoyltetrahydropterin/6-carboxytetrahydropterin synthase
MYSVTKEIYFCYGHRLMNHPGKCRHLHGHSVKASITVTAPELNDQGMVCDFADIAEAAGAFIDSQLDHNFLLHQDDPLVATLAAANERFTAVPEHPTSEYLARLIYQHMKSQGLAVESVVLWETSSSCARYHEP